MQSTLKRSKQRDAIIAFLMTCKDHPTADTIYMNIKKEFPNISLGTVYRNLALLSERGEILKLTYHQGADRYDAIVDPHYHFICRECGEVMDLEMDSLDEKVTAMANVGFPGKVEESVIYFKGICEKCLKNKSDKGTMK